jgi:lipid-A-disaccharide synthase
VSNKNSKLVLIVAGEASADLHGSNLVRAMRRMDPGISFQGIGGREMQDAGVEILVPSSQMAVVGLTEVLSRLFAIVRAYVRLKNLLHKADPSLLVLIDYPDFNLMLAGVAKRCKVPVLYYISPQIWAWRTGRIQKISSRVDRMAVILPFEQDFYRKRGIHVEYVGHPLMDLVPPRLGPCPLWKGAGVEADPPLIGLLPGSRKDEIRNLLPPMVRAVEILWSRYPGLKCILPVASTISPDMIRSAMGQTSVQIELIQGTMYERLCSCQLALVASGTATLEVAIMGVPMVIVYRVSPVTYRIAKRIIRVPHVGLVNLVAGEEVVPELIQDEVTPHKMALEAIRILEHSRERENMIKKLNSVRQRLGKGGASERAAMIAMDIMGIRPQADKR